MLLRISILGCIYVIVTWTYATLAFTSILPLYVDHFKRLYAFDVHVTLGKYAPDGVERNIILVNGLYQPGFDIIQNYTVQVNVHNHLPDAWPSVSNGITIHWHGFSMWDEGIWMDGTAYLSQCPISSGTNYTYTFQAVESPGTYFWHDHDSGNRHDGLQGPVVVRPAPDLQEPWQYDTEAVLFLTDQWHTSGNAMLMGLNRPMDFNKVTPDSGMYLSVGAPASVTINGAGFYQDCNTRNSPTTCNPISFASPPTFFMQPHNHSVVNVVWGQVTRVRIINAGFTSYFSLCFEGHTVKLIALDSTPSEPAYLNCVDVDSGQRADVLLTADQPARNYWISVHIQHHSGPSGFAVLHYNGAPTNAFPATPAPQPGTVAPWTLDFINSLETESDLTYDPTLLNPYLEPSPFLEGNMFYHKGEKTLVPPQHHSREIWLNITEPIINDTGQVRWAFNNVAQPLSPPCTPIMKNVLHIPDFMEKGIKFRTNVYSKQRGNANFGRNVNVFVDGQPAQLYPTVAAHVAEIRANEVVDIVLQNLPSGALNGDNQPGLSRNSSSPHPIHLHGHHFWVMASGTGIFQRESAALNYANAIFRDVVTVPAGGWVLIRFTANNPGMWPLHCHIFSHSFMGQAMYIMEARRNWPKPPAVMPKCTVSCPYTFAPWSRSDVKKQYGSSAYPLPD